MTYIRKCTLSLDEVLPLLVKSEPGDKYYKMNRRDVIRGGEVKVDTLRLQVFKRSQTCVCCGMQATHFALEKHPTHETVRYHLNMYGMEGGKEILFTKDHLKPKAKGGTDTLDNLETMCTICNNLKADTYDQQ